ncbi:hypothetical protein BC828DRAFT_294361 [Blastocladiella britannica]|nr:hypothetical protein BC828DRAFT_294361 [Blastocladiella britannica]
MCSWSAQAAIECGPAPPAAVLPSWPLTLPLARFAARVCSRSPTQHGCPSAVILAATHFLLRARAALPTSARGIPSTHHRLLLAAVITASKVLDDRHVRNVAWADAVAVPLAECNLMERQFLALLDYKVNVSASDLAAALALVRPASSASSSGLRSAPSRCCSALSTTSSCKAVVDEGLDEDMALGWDREMEEDDVNDGDSIDAESPCISTMAALSVPQIRRASSSCAPPPTASVVADEQSVRALWNRVMSSLSNKRSSGSVSPPSVSPVEVAASATATTSSSPSPAGRRDTTMQLRPYKPFPLADIATHAVEHPPAAAAASSSMLSTASWSKTASRRDSGIADDGTASSIARMVSRSPNNGQSSPMLARAT